MMYFGSMVVLFWDVLNNLELGVSGFFFSISGVHLFRGPSLFGFLY